MQRFRKCVRAQRLKRGDVVELLLELIAKEIVILQ